MRKLLPILLLFSMRPAWAAPSVVDSCANTGTATSVSCTINSDTGSNLLLIVGVFCANSVTINTVTHNGDSATAISATVESTGGASRLRAFYRLAPDVGTGLTVTSTLSSTASHLLIAVIVKDALQQAPNNEATFDPELNGQPSGSYTTTSATGNLVVDFFGLGQASNADDQVVTPGGGQTQLEDVIVTDNFQFMSSWEAGATSVTTSWSWTPGGPHRLARAYNIEVAAPSVFPAHYYRMMSIQ